MDVGGLQSAIYMRVMASQITGNTTVCLIGFQAEKKKKKIETPQYGPFGGRIH